MDARTFQRLLDKVDDLSQLQGEQMAAALQRRSLRQHTIAIIEARPQQSLACPRCRSSHQHRHGAAHGLQRFRCVPCGRTFNRLTGTLSCTVNSGHARFKQRVPVYRISQRMILAIHS